MFDSLLVANRGEIARRVIRTARRMGLRTIAVYSEVDATLPFVAEADEAVLIGPAAAAESYNNAYAILKAAKVTGAQAIHPGYGFLSENSEFAEAVEGAGLVWVGPSAKAIVAMGNKVAARNLVAAAGVPVAPGTEAPVTTAAAAAEAAGLIGFPLSGLTQVCSLGSTRRPGSWPRPCSRSAVTRPVGPPGCLTRPSHVSDGPRYIGLT